MPTLIHEKNLRTEELLELKQANNAWTDCISKNFLNQWLSGKNLNIEEVCKEEL
jgi:UDP-N-acetylglucosamine pyrophosphorylase